MFFTLLAGVGAMRPGALPIVSFVAVAASKGAAVALRTIWPEGSAPSVDAVLSLSVSCPSESSVLIQSSAESSPLAFTG